MGSDCWIAEDYNSTKRHRLLPRFDIRNKCIWIPFQYELMRYLHKYLCSRAHKSTSTYNIIQLNSISWAVNRWQLPTVQHRRVNIIKIKHIMKSEEIHRLHTDGIMRWAAISCLESSLEINHLRPCNYLFKKAHWFITICDLFSKKLRDALLRMMEAIGEYEIATVNRKSTPKPRKWPLDVQFVYCNVTNIIVHWSKI